MRAVFVVLIAAILVGCLTPPAASVNSPGSNTVGTDGEKRVCKADADCVAEQCCHPTSSVNTLNAPECGEAVCTLDCKPGTVDCGQGYFACASGQCVAMYYQ